MDKCAIYILIAGSYTPFLQVVLSHEPRFSNYLLFFLWILCIMGIGVEFVLPNWIYKPRFSLAMYLGMGWSALVCLPEVARSIPKEGIHLMVMGGVAYTAGVPFFVRNNSTYYNVSNRAYLLWCLVYVWRCIFLSPSILLYCILDLDHAIWHLFVLAGSAFHWCGIYFYVAPLPLHHIVGSSR